MQDVTNETEIVSEETLTPVPETVVDAAAGSEPQLPTSEAEAIEKFNKMSPDQQALLTFQSNLNQFVKKLVKFEGSRRQLKELLINLAVAPLNKDELKFSYPEVKELFELGEVINSAKFLLMNVGFQRAKEAEEMRNAAAQNAESVAETVTEKTLNEEKPLTEEQTSATV